MLHFDSPLMFVAGDNITKHPDIGYNNAGYQNETFVDAFVNYGKVRLSNFWLRFDKNMILIPACGHRFFFLTMQTESRSG